MALKRHPDFRFNNGFIKVRRWQSNSSYNFNDYEGLLLLIKEEHGYYSS